MANYDEEFFVGKNNTQDDTNKTTLFPSKFKCIVCDINTSNLAKLHRHQMTDHTREELSMSLISLHSYIYHKQYFESSNLINNKSDDQCRYYPFCSTLLNENNKNHLNGEWIALTNNTSSMKKVETKPQIITIDDKKIKSNNINTKNQQVYKLTKLPNDTNAANLNGSLTSTSTTLTSSKQLNTGTLSPSLPHDLSIAKTLLDNSNKINLKRLGTKESRPRKLATLRSTPTRKPNIDRSSMPITTTTLGLNLTLQTQPELDPSISFLSKTNLAKHDNEVDGKPKWVPIPSIESSNK